MQSDIAEIEEADIQLVGVSYDAVGVLHEFAEQRNVTFPLLSDPNSEVISAWGVLNDNARGGQEGVPNPSTVVVDRSGTVRALLEGSVAKRHSTEALLAAAKEIEAAPAP